MTHAEIRALLARCDPRQLRTDAGISVHTVCQALSVPPKYVYRWEGKEAVPSSYAGLRWLKFTAALYRHALVDAELAAAERQAA